MDYVAQVKDKNNNIRPMGFGHRVYKNFDPRARNIKKECEAVLSAAEEREAAALEDDYFVERKLYPNVNFYSGVILRARIPTSMFTVIFAIGRMPDWIAHWYEARFLAKGRINRPRQVWPRTSRRSTRTMWRRASSTPPWSQRPGSAEPMGGAARRGAGDGHAARAGAAGHRPGSRQGIFEPKVHSGPVRARGQDQQPSATSAESR